MSIRPIKTHKEYKKALSYIERHLSTPPNSLEADTVEILAILVEKYEDEHFPIDYPDPIEAIKFRMEQLGWTNKDLARILGTRARVSEILSRKRTLSITMIKNIHQELNVPADILLNQ